MNEIERDLQEALQVAHRKDLHHRYDDAQQDDHQVSGGYDYAKMAEHLEVLGWIPPITTSTEEEQLRLLDAIDGYQTVTPSESFPCIICGRSLERVMPDAEAQPSDGIMCETNGNYGSTIWDSMDGEVLCFNICDSCMVTAGDQGRVYVRRKHRLILVSAGALKRMVIGYEILNRPYVRWRNGLDEDDDSIVMNLEEIEQLSHRQGTRIQDPYPPARVVLTTTPEAIRMMADHEWTSGPLAADGDDSGDS